MQEQDSTVEQAWEAIGRWYAAPGAEEACLTLQGRAGLSVTTMLALLWLAADDQGAVHPAGLLALDGAAAYQQQVLVPLRQARRGLKAWVEQLGAPATELRQALMRYELDAERLDLLLVLQALAPEACRTRTGDPCGDACLSMARYLQAAGVNPDDAGLRQQLVRLLCVVLEDYDSLQVEAVLRLALKQARQEQ